MQLQVGKAYKARNGEKVTIFDNNHIDYPFYGDNGNSYTRDGRQFKFQESQNDLISEWVEEPKYKAGDRVEIELSDKQAKTWNVYHEFKIISHTPAPEPAFDWSKIEQGMAFDYTNSVYDFKDGVRFVTKHPKNPDVGIFEDIKNNNRLLAIHKDNLGKYTAKNDIVY